MSRKIMTILLLVLGLSILHAQVPHLLNYQGKLADPDGNPLNGTYSLQFLVFDQLEGGTELWSETHNSVNVSNGFFNVILGSITSVTTDLYSGSGDRYLEIVVGAETLAPRFRLTSVAYSLRAEEADNVADSSVTTVKLANGAVTQQKLDSDVRTVPAGDAGGDLSATYPNPRVAKIQGQAVSSAAPADGQVLKWSATNSRWEAATDVSGGTVNTTARLSGDGTAGAPLDIAQQSAKTDDVLKWNGTSWAPAADESGADGDWTISGDNIYHLTGNVSIGTSNAPAKLYITDATTAGSALDVSKTAGQAVTAIRGTNNAAPPSGFVNSGGIFTADADAEGAKYAVQAHARGGGVTNVGGYFNAQDATTNYAIYAQGDLNYFSGDVGIGTNVPGYKLHVRGGSIYSDWTHDTDQTPSVYIRNFNAGTFTPSPQTYGVWSGASSDGTESKIALAGYATGSAGVKKGLEVMATGTGTTNYGLLAYAAGATTNWAGYFNGNVHVSGTLSKSAGSFRIDHPLDPQNKYLQHSFVESPDMMNIYNGNVILDSNGEAWVELPEWFGALNRDFRYQLTCIGGYAQVYIAEKMQNNRFKIAGGQAGLEVSWQVTGIRQDPFAEKNRIEVEILKAPNERGKYLHPQLYNQPVEMGIDSDLLLRDQKQAGE